MVIIDKTIALDGAKEKKGNKAPREGGKEDKRKPQRQWMLVVVVSLRLQAAG